MTGWHRRSAACAPRAQPLRTVASGFVSLLVMLVAGCALPPGPPDRDPEAPIGVSSRYDAARFAGPWHVRGAFEIDAGLTRVERIATASDASLWRLSTRGCASDAAVCPEAVAAWPAKIVQPGADRLRDPGGGPARLAVVMWIDDAYRTAAVGDPSGRFAWVLDRSPRGGADRIQAARQVLAFSGFDLGEMEMRP